MSFPKPKVTSHRSRRASAYRKFLDAAWELHSVPGEDSVACARCRRSVARGEGAEIDHIKPKSTHPELKYDPTNTRVTCGPCNRWFKTHPLERER